MTNVEALKAVYTAIGGDAADVANAKTTAKVIEKISEIATPGGGGGGGGENIISKPAKWYMDQYHKGIKCKTAGYTFQDLIDDLASGKLVDLVVDTVDYGGISPIEDDPIDLNYIIRMTGYTHYKYDNGGGDMQDAYSLYSGYGLMDVARVTSTAELNDEFVIILS